MALDAGRAPHYGADPAPLDRPPGGAVRGRRERNTTEAASGFDARTDHAYPSIRPARQSPAGCSSVARVAGAGAPSRTRASARRATAVRLRTAHSSRVLPDHRDHLDALDD